MNLLSAPLKVDLNVTRRCNYNCDFCYVTERNTLDSEMSLSDLRHILDELKKNNMFEVNISGGEPFARPDILQVFDLLMEYDFYYSLNTNGSLLNEENIQKIKDVGFEYVGISLDASTETTYKKNRGSGANYSNTLKGIKALVAAGVNVLGQTTLSQENIHNIPQTISKANELGMKSIGLQFICPVNDISKKSMPNYNQWKKAFIELTDLKKENAIEIPISFNTTNESEIPWEMYLPLKEENRLNDLYEVWGVEVDAGQKCGHLSCVAGFNTCAIAPNGDVYGCEMFFAFENLRFGNVLQKSFKEVWENTVRFQSSNEKKDLKGKCGSCKLDFCGGGCRAAAYYYHGDILHSDLRCPIADEHNTDPLEDENGNN